MNSLFDEYNKCKDKLQWVFFDFFDTIVKRRCKPEEVKKIWARWVISEVGLGIDARYLYTIRRESEVYISNSKRISCGEYQQGELYGEIYNRLLYSGILGGSTVISRKDFNRICITCEKNIEINLQYLNEDLLGVIREIKRDGKKIGCISDFFLSRQDIQEFMSSHGILELFDEVFVSGEIGQNKSSGSMYQYVAAKLNVLPNECMMIGDNYGVDYVNAKRAGFEACRISSKECKSIVLGLKELKKKIRSFSKSSSKLELPYNDYVYSLFVFISNLYISLRSNGVKNVFFLAREGEYLKTIFDLYGDYFIPDNGDTIKSHYLYVSRRSTFLPSLNQLHDEDFCTLFRQYKKISAIDFLRNLGFEEREIESIAKRMPFDINRVYEDLPSREEFMQLLKDEHFAEVYEKNRLDQKKALINYLQTFSVDFVKEGLHVVDVGWKGTIQDNLRKLLNDEIHINGYYLGLCDGGDIDMHNRKIGILFSFLPVRSKFYDVWAYDYTLFERILYASHGSTRKYSSSDKPGPIIENKSEESESYNLIKPIQRSIGEQFRQLCILFQYQSVLPRDCEESFARNHFIATRLVDGGKKEFQGLLINRHYENFGHFHLLNVEQNKKLFVNKTIVLNFDSIFYLPEILCRVGLNRLALFLINPLWAIYKKKYSI